MSFTWYGTATYFDSCPSTPHTGGGAGACATCYNNEAGIAYPTVTGHATPNYDYSCTYQFNGGGMPTLSCGTYLGLTGEYCTSRNTVFAPIVDHGPGAGCHLDRVACNGVFYTYAYRLLDLTPTTFSVLGNLASGFVQMFFTTP